MRITVQCGCGKRYSAPDTSAGRTFPCKECGTTLTVPGGAESAEESAAATRDWILEARQTGATRGSLRQQLVAKGFTDDEARSAIDAALSVSEGPRGRAGPRPSYAADTSGGFPGWLVWIGTLIAINILSAVFDWPFWVF